MKKKGSLIVFAITILLFSAINIAVFAKSEETQTSIQREAYTYDQGICLVPGNNYTCEVIKKRPIGFPISFGNITTNYSDSNDKSFTMTNTLGLIADLAFSLVFAWFTYFIITKLRSRKKSS